MRNSLILATVLTVLAGVAHADLSRGLDLFEQGEFQAALGELKPEADTGDARAQYVIGVMYLNGLVDAPGPDAAAALIRSAAKQNYRQAQTELARMYRTGDGVEQDDAEMLKWYTRAAENGDVGAQLLVADSYAYGHGVDPNLVEAYKWYEIAIRYWGPLAVRARDVVGEDMTAAQIAEGVRRASDWLQAHPTDKS